MVPANIRETIDKMGLPVIALGDLDQLPPVAGKPGYLTHPETVHCLTEIMRQAQDNGIIQVSQLAIRGKDIPIGHYPNIDVIYKEDLTDDMIRQSQIVICNTSEKYLSIKLVKQRYEPYLKPLNYSYGIYHPYESIDSIKLVCDANMPTAKEICLIISS